MLGAEIDLMPNEKMVLASNPHWFYFWKEVAGAGVLIVILFIMATIDVSWIDNSLRWLFIIGIVLLLVSVGFRYANWKTTRFAITSERVAYQSGMFRRRGVSIPLNRVNNVNFHQSLIARMLNNGVVTIESAGETGDSVFENIPDPEHVRTLIFKQVEADEQADSDRDAAALAKAMRDQIPPAGDAAPAPPSAQDRLAALEDMKEQGLVNDAEYATKRQQILDEF
jgi:uncharacterized membrane protein YdbT with pleckstrin-like domain